MREKAFNVVADYYARDFVETLLDAAGDAAVSAGSDTESYDRFTVGFKAADVTTGATVQIEVQLESGGDWFLIHQQAITASGTAVMQFNGPFYAVRATIPTATYTDGEYTVVLRGKR